MPRRAKNGIKKVLGLPLTRLHDDWSMLKVIGPVTQEHVLLDIGAHHGWFFHCWQDWCPGARVIAFEPFKESFEKMVLNYGDDVRVKLVQSGVGAVNGLMKLNVLNDSKVSNSFLKPDDKTWQSISFQHGQVSEINVPVTTIDNVFIEERLSRVYLLKIDVQGYEIEVLKGAEKSLFKIDYIFVESGIQRLYENAPRFSEVFEFLSNRGFHLMGMRSWHRGNHVLVETDMLFRRDDLAGTIDPTIERIYQ